MKLITEVNHDVEYVTEQKDGKNSYFIEGIFLQANSWQKIEITKVASFLLM